MLLPIRQHLRNSARRRCSRSNVLPLRDLGGCLHGCLLRSLGPAEGGRSLNMSLTHAGLCKSTSCVKQQLGGVRCGNLMAADIVCVRQQPSMLHRL